VVPGRRHDAPSVRTERSAQDLVLVSLEDRKSEGHWQLEGRAADANANFTHVFPTAAPTLRKLASMRTGLASSAAVVRRHRFCVEVLLPCTSLQVARIWELEKSSRAVPIDLKSAGAADRLDEHARDDILFVRLRYARGPRRIACSLRTADIRVEIL
jgi:hypothetical protein